MKNFYNDYLFPSFLTSGEVENLNNISILNECLAAKNNDPQGLIKSNVDGWHSELFREANTEYENLNKLCVEAMNFGNFVARAQNLNQVFRKIDWWININPKNTYNAIHSHPKADLSIVYYVQLNDNTGDLVFMRNDGATHLDLFAKQMGGLRFSLQPQVGRMYAFPSHILHYVQSNQSEVDRISIAYNLTI